MTLALHAAGCVPAEDLTASESSAVGDKPSFYYGEIALGFAGQFSKTLRAIPPLSASVIVDLRDRPDASKDFPGVEGHSCSLHVDYRLANEQVDDRGKVSVFTDDPLAAPPCSLDGGCLVEVFTPGTRQFDVGGPEQTLVVPFEKDKMQARRVVIEPSGALLANQVKLALNCTGR